MSHAPGGDQAMNRASGQTLRKATALAWEFWAHGWRGFLWGMAGIFTIPGLIFAIEMGRPGGVPRALHVTGSLLCLVPFYWVIVLALGALIRPSLENPRLRYTLPASSPLLVVVTMACAMVAMFVQYAIVAMILNALFDTRWTIVGPGLLAAVLIAWCQAVLLSTSNSPGLRWFAILASVVALVLTVARWGPVIRPEKMADFLPGVGGREMLSFGLATLACVGLGILGFAKLRHGSGIDLRWIGDWLSERLDFRWAPRAKPFSSARAAQFWLECQERGYVLPVVATMFGTAAVVLALCVPARHITNGKPTDFAVFATILMFSALVAIGFYWGSRSPNLDFRAFNGSRPLSDGQLATAVLKSATLGLILSALIWTAFMVLVAWIVAMRQKYSMPLGAVNRTDVVDYLCGTTLGALAVWSAVSFITSLALGGKKVLGVAFGLFFGCYVLLPSMSQSLPYAFQPDISAEAYFKGCLVLWLVLCAAAFVAGWRWHLISVPTLCLAATLIVTAVAAAHFAGMPFERRYWPHVVFCCLIPLPLAAAPLAVCVNRHR